MHLFRLPCLAARTPDSRLEGVDAYPLTFTPRLPYTKARQQRIAFKLAQLDGTSLPCDSRLTSGRWHSNDALTEGSVGIHMAAHAPISFNGLTSVESSVRTIKRMPTGLLDLPVEILQMVLQVMEPGTLYITLQTCKQLFNAAKAKPVLLDQLNRLPGIRLGLEDLSTKKLSNKFRKRVSKNLNAVDVLADVTRYGPSSQKLKISQCVFDSGSPAYFATVHQHSATVKVYELAAGHIRLKAELNTGLSDSYAGDVEVLKVAFASTRDLAVLYRYMPRSIKRPSPFVDDAAYRANHTLKLVTFHYLHAATKDSFYRNSVQETRDIRHGRDQEPVGLALAEDGNACISWRVGLGQRTEMFIYGRDSKIMDTSGYEPSPAYNGFQSISGHGTDWLVGQQVFGIRFVLSGKSINFFGPGNPIHSWYSYSSNPRAASSGITTDNRILLPMSGNRIIPPTPTDVQEYDFFAVGMPFHVCHTRNIFSSNSSEYMCHDSYLAVGVTTGSSRKRSAFIVQCDQERLADECKHEPNAENGITVPFKKPIALLAGWQRGNSSLGSVMAISPLGTHIAMATWDKLLVWSLNPDLLHQGSVECYFPRRDYNRTNEIGRLRPVKLPSQGVVHSMVWVDEDNLYAMTDRGLIKWFVGPRCSGEREQLSMDFDAWPV